MYFLHIADRWPPGSQWLEKTQPGWAFLHRTCPAGLAEHELLTPHPETWHKRFPPCDQPSYHIHWGSQFPQIEQALQKRLHRSPSYATQQEHIITCTGMDAHNWPHMWKCAMPASNLDAVNLITSVFVWQVWNCSNFQVPCFSESVQLHCKTIRRCVYHTWLIKLPKPLTS